ncbi:MAG: hypothetical protein QM775_06550 [Pirellulales bacterium]
MQQLELIAKRTKELVAAQYRCWNEQIVPQLAEQKIRILHPNQLAPEHHAILDKFFNERAYPILTPMAVDPAHPSPRFHNRGLYLAARLRRNAGLGPKNMFGVVQLPQVLPRLVTLAQGEEQLYIMLEDAVAMRLAELFGGSEVVNHTYFRITRDSDIELLEQEADDMLQVIEDRLKARQRGQAVRLEVSADGDEELIREIVEPEAVHEPSAADAYSEVYRVPGPIDLTALMELLKMPGREHLRDAPFTPQPPRGRGQRGKEDLFAAIRRHDILLHHPYDAFDAVVEFVSRAAVDPNVLAIKQTLYRTSGDSPVTRALIQAAENGKHVTARRGTEGALRRRKQRRLGAEAGTGRRTRGVRILGPEDALQIVVGRAPRRAHDPSLRAPRHGQLQPEHGADLYRSRFVYGRRRRHGRRFGAVQPVDRLLAGAQVAEVGRRADRFASPYRGTHRRTNAAGERRTAVADLREAQFVGRLSRD